MITTIRNSSYHKWLVLLTVGIQIITGGIDNGSLSLALPKLSIIFGVGPDIILWLVAAFMVVAVGLALTWGSLGDTFGRKQVYLWGFIVFSAGLCILAVSQTVPQLIFGRVIQAVGQSMTVTNGFAIAVAVFPLNQRGLVIGLVGGLVGVGLSIGPIFGAFILANFHWRLLFWTRIPLSLIAMGLVAIIIPPDPQLMRTKRTFDYFGAISLFIGLTSLLLIINRFPIEGFSSLRIIILIIICILSTTFFFINERKVKNPVLDLSLFKSKFLSISLLIHFMHFLAYMLLFFLIPFFLISGKGLETSQVGLLVASIQIVRLFVSPMAGILGDYFGSARMSTIGLILTTFGIGMMSQLGPDSNILLILGSLMTTGLGASIFDPSNEHSVLSAIPNEKLASGTALTATARQIGFSISTTIAGTLYASRLRFYEVDLEYHLAVTKSFQEVLYIGLTIMALATIFSLMRGKDKR